MSEEWRIIPDFPDHEASDMGHIRKAGESALPEVAGSDEYLRVFIEPPGVWCRVDWLVLHTFRGNPPGTPQIPWGKSNLWETP